MRAPGLARRGLKRSFVPPRMAGESETNPNTGEKPTKKPAPTLATKTTTSGDAFTAECTVNPLNHSPGDGSAKHNHPKLDAPALLKAPGFQTASSRVTSHRDSVKAALSAAAPSSYGIAALFKKSDAGYTLNKEQKEAVQTKAACVAVSAGPGTGKTKVIVSRVEFLIKELQFSPQSILVVTFTRKAARELRDRLCGLLGKEQAALVRATTFHAFCAMILKRFGETGGCSLLDRDGQLKLMRQALLKLGSCSSCKAKKYLEFVSDRLNRSTIPEQTSQVEKDAKRTTDSGGETTCTCELPPPRVMDEYQTLKRSGSFLDFDDLLAMVSQRIGREPEWLQKVAGPEGLGLECILVDEWQDTNALQYDIVKALGSMLRYIMVVGDTDQSIYGWRHSRKDNLDKFYVDFEMVEAIRLQQCYRSFNKTLRVCRRIITDGSCAGALQSTRGDGPPVLLSVVGTTDDEAKLVIEKISDLIRTHKVPLNEIAVLYRCHALSRAVEVHCARNKIPYECRGGNTFLESSLVKLVLSAARLIINPRDWVSLELCLLYRKRVSKANVEAVIKAMQESTRIETPLAFVQRASLPIGVANTVVAFLRKVELWREAIGGAVEDTLRKIVDYFGLMEEPESGEPMDDDAMSSASCLADFMSMAASHEFSDSAEGESPLEEFLSGLALDGKSGIETKRTNEKKVCLSTAHAAKGLEWGHVFVISVDDSSFPLARNEDVEEERRLLYVACTRAKDVLTITCCRRKRTHGQWEDVTPSRFLRNSVISALQDGSGDVVDE